jgi:hypothetical protein
MDNIERRMNLFASAEAWGKAATAYAQAGDIEGMKRCRLEAAKRMEQRALIFDLEVNPWKAKIAR